MSEQAVVEIALFSQVGHNVWMGGGPRDCLPPGTQFVVSLHPRLEYTVPAGITVTRAWLEDEHEIPDVRHLVALARWVSDVRKIGPVLVHCEMGLNRSGLILALAMMVDGASAEQAITQLRNARSEHVLFNSTFEAWLRNAAAAALEKY